MTQSAKPAIERLGEFLNKAPHLHETQSLRKTYRWIGSVGGLDGLDWMLMERESLGLDDAELTDSQAAWMARLKALVTRSILERQKQRERQPVPSLTYAERCAHIMRRRDEDDRKRLAMYDHVPKPQRRLTVHERMEKAWKRLNLPK